MFGSKLCWSAGLPYAVPPHPSENFVYARPFVRAGLPYAVPPHPHLSERINPCFPAKRSERFFQATCVPSLLASPTRRRPLSVQPLAYPPGGLGRLPPWPRPQGLDGVGSRRTNLSTLGVRQVLYVSDAGALATRQASEALAAAARDHKDKVRLHYQK